MVAAKTSAAATARTRDPRLDHLLARRADDRRRSVALQVASAINALRLAGTEVSLIGSLARGDFRVISDVNLLVMNRGASDRDADFRRDLRPPEGIQLRSGLRRPGGAGKPSIDARDCEGSGMRHPVSTCSSRAAAPCRPRQGPTKGHAVTSS